MSVFVTLEGGEGVGKSTQLVRLAEALRQRGLSVITTREPGGTTGAEAIRALLMEGEADRWTARSEVLLFAAARADHVARVIRPALDAGQWVLCDRYVDSTRAYQGAAGAIDDTDILALHRIGCLGLMPVRTLLLRLPPEIAAERLAARGGIDRMGSRGPEYFAAVDNGFARIAANEPARVRVIRADGAATDVSARLVAQLVDLI